MDETAEGMTWDYYEIYNPGVFGPLNRLVRRDPRRAFSARMEAKPRRIEMLRQLLRANGVELGSTDAAIQDLNDWFRTNVEADRDKPGRLLPGWYSLVNDVALFLGDVMLERCPGPRWEFYTWGKNNASYQRHVIMGFRRVPNPRYNVDIDAAVAAYAHRIVAGRGSVPRSGRVTVRGVEIGVDAVSASQRRLEVENDAFCRWVKSAESQA